jgi:hypothetical protein
MIECVEIEKGSVCFRAKQLIAAEKEKAEDLKFDYDQVKNTAFMTGIFCALHILRLIDSETAAVEIVKQNTTIGEMSSYVIQHGSEADCDTLLWVRKIIN